MPSTALRSTYAACIVPPEAEEAQAVSTQLRESPCSPSLLGRQIRHGGFYKRLVRASHMAPRAEHIEPRVERLEAHAERQGGLLLVALELVEGGEDEPPLGVLERGADPHPQHRQLLGPGSERPGPGARHQLG